jgi:hypothetical protein
MTQEPSDAPLAVPIPTSSTIPSYRSTTSITPLVCDERAIMRLLETMLSRGGLSVNEAASRLGVTSNAIRQYLKGRRAKPSLMWFIRLAEVCGAKVTVEWPTRK